MELSPGLWGEIWGVKAQQFKIGLGYFVLSLHNVSYTVIFAIIFSQVINL